jgi:hypothetical protein
MGIGRGLGSPFFQRIGAQARPIVKLIGLDERYVEKVADVCLSASLISNPVRGIGLEAAPSAMVGART